MANASQIREQMEVVGSDGQHVGTVDKVEGDRIKLTKNDPQAQGQHRYIPLHMVESVEPNAVRLDVPADQARQQATGDDSIGTKSGSMGHAGGSR
ncbi:MAG: DUF2171 domain-containing protein [Acidobacteria bacterium]|nr:DUF2171 domain-containing protein [Acidobacteriota bacterium]